MKNARWLLIVLALALAGCGEETITDPEAMVVVTPDKADNFFSVSAQEYFITGEYYVELEESYGSLSEEEQLVRVKELIGLKQVAVNWFLLQHFVGTEEHEHKYKALTKNGSYEDLDVRQDGENPLKYYFRFQQEVGGQMNLIKDLGAKELDDGSFSFDLVVGRVANSDLEDVSINQEWYRRAPWSSFNPAEVSEDKKETLTLNIKPQARSTDAWLDYKRLFEDGKVTIGIHYGWDYHNEYHLVYSESMYNWLVNERGFKSPVSGYDKYTRTSGPLTRTIKADGKDVKVEVSLFWGKPGTDSDPDTAAGGINLENDMRQSFAQREVIIFSGHSGPFYGFALANWRKTDEGDLDDSELPDLDMPETYQVVFSKGCDTYAMGEAFWANPAKGGEDNLDVITSTSFSSAGTDNGVKYFLTAIFGTGKGELEPVKLSTLLGQLDSTSSWFATMFGIHGIDDNPRVHPFGHLENLCKACKTHSDCGGVGNSCVYLSNDEKVCTVECLDTNGCPEGYVCQNTASGNTVSSKQCVPSTFSCNLEPEDQGLPILINEVLVAPALGKSGDANLDGKRSGTDDEFIELVSNTSSTLGLDGLTLSDSTGTRFVFPEGTQLLPGRSLVVFGGGDPEKCFDFEKEFGAQVFFADKLGLNNWGDRVTLAGPDGQVIDEVTWGFKTWSGKSLVRKVDGDPEAEWILSPKAPTPGQTSDGSLF